jgi:hypothetical protein
MPTCPMGDDARTDTMIVGALGRYAGWMPPVESTCVNAAANETLINPPRALIRTRSL